MSLKILGLRQTICLALPKIFCTTFKSISKFYAFGFLKFNQISVRYFLLRYARSRERTRWVLQSIKKHPKKQIGNNQAHYFSLYFTLRVRNETSLRGCEAGFKFYSVITSSVTSVVKLKTAASKSKIFRL